MLFTSVENPNHAYGFRFQPIEQNKIATIQIIGHESRCSKDYYWDGLKRDDAETYIFQYTLSGNGIFEVDGITHEISAGKAFFVSIPSHHRYFLPQKSKHWEFIFMTLKGKEAQKCWNFINEEHGYVFNMNLDTALIQKLLLTYKITVARDLNDPYLVSQKAYEFIMECYSYFQKAQNLNTHELPTNLRQALIYMQTHYNLPLTLEDIAERANISKFYFTKKFKEHMNISPLQYLTKYRIEKAFYLLQNTDKTVKDISSEVGFSDPNYFCKVFRQIVGTSPNKFRNANEIKPFTDLITE